MLEIEWRLCIDTAEPSQGTGNQRINKLAKTDLSSFFVSMKQARNLDRLWSKGIVYEDPLYRRLQCPWHIIAHEDTNYGVRAGNPNV